MGQYITSAKINPDGIVTISRIIKHLEDIHRTHTINKDGIFIYFNTDYNPYMGRQGEDKLICIDCNLYANGDEELAVKLFLELAKMRDECYKGQWIWNQCNETGEITNLHKSNGKYVMYCFKYATPLDLAEAVKDGKIKL